MRFDRSPSCKAIPYAFASLWLALLASACGVPNLDPPDCTQARDRVREFYSFHFGNDMSPTLENVRLRERFLTQDHAARLVVDASGLPPTKVDYFTFSEEFPKTFRIGECRVIEPGRIVDFEVLLFWKDDTRSEQKEIVAITKYENDAWRIDAVGPKDR